MTSADLAARQYESYGIFGKYKTLLGDPEVGCALLLHGQPGHGKSSLAIDLSHYFAAYHGPVLYCSSEQYDSKSLQDNLHRAGGAVRGLDFSKKLPTDRELANYDFLAIDSVAHLGLTLAQFTTLRERHPSLCIILIQQVTKTGAYRGTTGWAHDVDVQIEVKEGVATTVKNRYGRISSIRLFDWGDVQAELDSDEPATKKKKRR